jgi:hypothetical protein
MYKKNISFPENTRKFFLRMTRIKHPQVPRPKDSHAKKKLKIIWGGTLAA